MKFDVVAKQRFPFSHQDPIITFASRMDESKPDSICINSKLSRSKFEEGIGERQSEMNRLDASIVYSNSRDPNPNPPIAGCTLIMNCGNVLIIFVFRSSGLCKG